jgi:hypothetical protein
MQEPRYSCAYCGRVRVIHTHNTRDRNKVRHLLERACALGDPTDLTSEDRRKHPHPCDLRYQAGFARFPSPVGQ